MSIRSAIEEAKAAGRLTPFGHPLGWVGKPRAFLMTERLYRQFDEALSSNEPKRVERWEYLRADIGHFVEGGLVTWSLMKWLEPKKYGNWELKSVRPRPSLRVFGRFAAPDVFVGTHIAERQALGGKWTLEWELEKLVCEELWESALGRSPPFCGSDYEDYITQNARRNPAVPQ